MSRGATANSQGTVFVTKTPNGSAFEVTAHHLSTVKDITGSDYLVPVERRWQKNLALFKKKPGQYDRGRDVTIMPLTSSVPRLDVSSGKTAPEIGQHFTLAGFPGSENSAFSTHSCFFKGYVVGKSSWGYPDPSYLMKCPNSLRSLEGISGGPMVDDKNRVFGVVVRGYEVDGTVIVTPISATATDLKIGLRENLKTDFCFRRISGGKFKKYTCVVGPGTTSDHY